MISLTVLENRFICSNRIVFCSQISLDQSALADHLLLDEIPSPDDEGGGGLGGKNSTKKALPTIFKYPATNAKEVYVCGTFSNWQKIRMNPSTKDFSTLVNLAEGDYEYKFLADGQWVCDPSGGDTVTNQEGIK